MFKRLTPEKSVQYFLFFLTFVAFSEVLQMQLKFIPEKIFNLLEIGSFMLMSLIVFRITNDFKDYVSYFYVIVALYFLYDTIIFSRGFELTVNSFKKFVQTDYPFWPIAIPLMVFLSKKDEVIMTLLKGIYTLCLIFYGLTVLDPKLITSRITAEPYIHAFVFPSGLLLMNARYLSKKKTWVVLGAILISVLSFTYLARRNAIVSYGGFLAFGLFFWFKSLSLPKFVKTLPIIAIVVASAVFAYDYIPPSLTAKLNERLNEDTRSDLFDNFFRAMEDHMVFGKGMNGKYYSPIDEMETEDGVRFDEVTNRDVIENGYLQLLLNGGIVYISLFVLFLLPATILGFFFTKNQFTQACAAIILLWMIDMFIFGLPRLTLEYIMVWVAAGICYKKDYRRKTNDEIQESFENYGLA